MRLLLAAAAAATVAATTSASPRLAGGASVQKLALYIGAGAGYQPTYHAVLSTAAASAFGPAGFTLANLTAAAVGQLTPEQYDVVVFPGGSGNGQAGAVGAAGLEALRRFVSAGKGYIGTCGGSFLGLQHVGFYLPSNHTPSCGLKPLPHCTPTTQQPWDRGDGDVLIEFTQAGLEQLNLPPSTYGGNVTIFYGQGPIVKPEALLSTVSQLAFYRTEIHSKHPAETTGEMVNTPAITTLDGYLMPGRSEGQGQGGRVVLNSPHPELTQPPIPAIYAGELQWVTRQR